MKKSKTQFLITGTSSGLGKYLHDHLGGVSFKRDGVNVEDAEVVIHSAFDRKREVTSENLYQYLLDNVFLTEKLVKLPHKKFIYISSVDVYPKNNTKHSENEIIDINQISSAYALTKLMAESIIQSLSPNFLILRCSALLGRDAKENSLIKMIKQENPTVTLSAESVCNFILHIDVLKFIHTAVEKNLQGIYNIVASKNITTGEIAELLEKKITFGNYVYNVGNIDNTKASQMIPALKKTSQETVKEFTDSVIE
jgi:nucleoside-diphosphate-sugar epimerase